MEVKVEECNIQGRGRDTPGLCLTCTKCEHQTEVYGTGDNSKRAGFAKLREECPEDEENFYTDGEDE